MQSESTNLQAEPKRATNNINSIGGSALQSPNESGLGTETELEIDQASDVAWNDQVRTLLGIIHSKENGEWEVTEAT